MCSWSLYCIENSKESENAYDPEPVSPSNEISDFWVSSRDHPRSSQLATIQLWGNQSWLPKAHMASLNYLSNWPFLCHPIAPKCCPKSEKKSCPQLLNSGPSLAGLASHVTVSKNEGHPKIRQNNVQYLQRWWGIHHPVHGNIISTNHQTVMFSIPC